jgi:hypothetical protein
LELAVYLVGLVWGREFGKQAPGLEPDKTRDGGWLYVHETIKEIRLFSGHPCQPQTGKSQQIQSENVWHGAKP